MSTWTADEVSRFLEAADALADYRTVTTARRGRNGGEYAYTLTRAADPMQTALWYVAALAGSRAAKCAACAGAIWTLRKAPRRYSVPG